MGSRAISFRGLMVTVACTDKARSEHFYEVILGAKRLPDHEYGCPWFRLGTLTLSLMPNAERPSPAAFPTDAMPILSLEVDDLSDAHRHLLSHEVTITEYHEETFLMCLDPDGILVEVWQAQSEPGGVD